MGSVSVNVLIPLLTPLHWQRMLLTPSLHLQGVWGCHLPDITSEHVHPISSEGPLWLRHVCPDPAGPGGGKS